MLKKLLISIALFASCALLLTACGGTEKTSNGNSNTTGTENGNKASTTSTPAASSSPASTTATNAVDKIGIPACDDYLTKYEACVSGKVPDAARAQYKSSLEQTRKSWREMAANPQTKAGLAKACQMASDQAKQTFKMFGCDF
jgi:hypothetical protein